eukprot:Awhi_evm1s14144
MSLKSNSTRRTLGQIFKSANSAWNSEKKSTLTKIDDSWLQGRGLFGGVSASLAMIAANAALDKPQQAELRSLLVTFAGPIIPGEVTASAHVLRQGKSVSTVESKVYHKRELGTSVMASFGNDRPTSKNYSPLVTMPASVPHYSNLSNNSVMSKHAHLPAFLQHYDIRWTHGRPFSQYADDNDIPFDGRHVSMWCRLKDNAGVNDKILNMASLVSICDVVPPVMLMNYSSRAPVSSLTWNLDIVHPISEDEQSARDPLENWYYLDFELLSANNGYSQQAGNIYDSKGVLVAYSRQTM